MSTAIIGTIVIGAIIFAGYKTYKKQKSGGCSGCSGCPHSGACGK